jgi:hypothetical protein
MPIPINNRVATSEDVEAGRCIFQIPDERSTPYSFGKELPVPAVITRDLGEDFPPVGARVEILQAEQGDTGDVIVGFVLGDQEFIGMLDDVQLLEAAE